ATWWKDGPEIESGERRTEDIATEVFFLPAAAHTEKDGSFTNTQRLLQWHHAAVEPRGDARSELWFMYHLGRRIRAKLAGSSDPMDRPVLDLTWDYPIKGRLDDPDAEEVLAEINGWHADGRPLSAYTELADDGSTTCGCWIYCGCRAGDVNQTARRKPGSEQSWVAPEWGWAWPANRRLLYNRASADPEGRPWSERKAYLWWDGEAAKWTGHDVPDFQVDKAPGYRPAPGARGPDAISGIDPFIMQSDGKAWLYAPAGLADGPLPTHYEPQESPFDNRLYGQQRNPVRQLLGPADGLNLFHPGAGSPTSDVFPYVATTYRLTEHHTAGGMSRWLPYLSELQPEMFCEISPSLAAERHLQHLGWATIVTARNAIEARVLVTDRMPTMVVSGRAMHQVGLPYHWGPNGYSTGDAANELMHLSLDPNVQIQEVKAITCDIRPGRRPRGAERVRFVEEYRRRAGITTETGREI
ncbi:MAG TPA: molybdopterin dinucleotide binding domain-containing protein, partial [Acidimicrobiales bacterium]|nr:molybdopterin dinucleotide binding domain-containing protein [Acidimicrobiales bacterium]